MRSRLLAPTCALLMLAASCSPPDVSVTGDEAPTKGIGAAGGAVTSGPGGAVLTIPAGSIGAQRLFSITATDDLEHGGIALGPAFKIEPGGTTFASPALLSLPTVAGAFGSAAASRVRVLHVSGPSGAQTALVPASADPVGLVVTVEVSSLSSFQPYLPPEDVDSDGGPDDAMAGDAGAADAADGDKTPDGQPTVSSPCVGGDELFVTTFADAYSDFANGVTARADGSFVVAGQFKSGANGGSGGKEPLLAAIGPTGALLWKKTFPGMDDEQAVAVVANPDGSLLMLVQGESTPNPARLFGLSATGDKQFGVHVVQESQKGVDAVALLHRGASVDAVLDVGLVEVWVARMDLTGKVLQVAKHAASSNFETLGASVHPKGVLVAGTLRTAATPNDPDAHVMLVDDSAVLWTATFADTHKQSAWAATAATDGGAYALWTSRLASSGVAASMHVTRLSASGKTLWTSQLEATQAFAPRSLHLLPDGDLMVSGRDKLAAGNDIDKGGQSKGYAIFLRRLTSTGAQRWVRHYPKGVDSFLGRSIATPDGGFALLRTVYDAPAYHADLLRTDGWGNVKCDGCASKPQSACTMGAGCQDGACGEAAVP